MFETTKDVLNESNQYEKIKYILSWQQYMQYSDFVRIKVLHVHKFKTLPY